MRKGTRHREIARKSTLGKPDHRGSNSGYRLCNGGYIGPRCIPTHLHPTLSPSMTGRQVAFPGLCLAAPLRFTAVASTAVRLGAACFILHTDTSSSASPSADRTVQSRAPSSSDGERSSLQIAAGCLPVCATLRINLGHHRGVSAAGNPHAISHYNFILSPNPRADTCWSWSIFGDN